MQGAMSGGEKSARIRAVPKPSALRRAETAAPGRASYRDTYIALGLALAFSVFDFVPEQMDDSLKRTRRRAPTSEILYLSLVGPSLHKLSLVSRMNLTRWANSAVSSLHTAR